MPRQTPAPPRLLAGGWPFSPAQLKSSFGKSVGVRLVKPCSKAQLGRRVTAARQSWERDGDCQRRGREGLSHAWQQPPHGERKSCNSRQRSQRRRFRGACPRVNEPVKLPQLQSGERNARANLPSCHWLLLPTPSPCTSNLVQPPGEPGSWSA